MENENVESISDDDLKKFQEVINKTKSVMAKEAKHAAVDSMSTICSSILTAMISHLTIEVFVLCLYKGFEGAYLALIMVGDNQSAGEIKRFADKFKKASLEFYDEEDKRRKK